MSTECRRIECVECFVVQQGEGDQGKGGLQSLEDDLKGYWREVSRTKNYDVSSEGM